MAYSIMGERERKREGRREEERGRGEREKGSGREGGREREEK